MYIYIYIYIFDYYKVLRLVGVQCSISMYVVQNRLLVSPTGYYKGMLDCFARCYKRGEVYECFRKKVILYRLYVFYHIKAVPEGEIVPLSLYGFMREKLLPEGEMS